MVYILGWGSATKTTLPPTLILHNKVLRIMSKTTLNDHFNNNLLHQKYSILTITKLYRFELQKFIYLYHVKAHQPEKFTSFFSTTSSSSYLQTYSTRSASYIIKLIS